MMIHMKEKVEIFALYPSAPQAGEVMSLVYVITPQKLPASCCNFTGMLFPT